jgi:hypothetical protein
MSLDQIVRAYIINCRKHARKELEYYASQSSFSEAIRVSVLSFTGKDEKRHDHQRRIPKNTLNIAETRLQDSADELRCASSFDELHGLIDARIGGIQGIGELTVYDVAHRIGAYLKLQPDFVYLHAGTRSGARRFGLRGTKIDPRQLPDPFRKLSAGEIEDCLCIYRKQIAKVLVQRGKWGLGD